ncbi:DUF1801 domain-containing protein [Aquimarina sp. AU474]|uniref:DUF1801 domain-containing protein n=1 Tax=Aquimarina sp. AU474 TaxID=2108529 RepID=UPI001F360898|nr:DUF1801 domain-containing protein [Aquimarina sp. AU474]
MQIKTNPEVEIVFDKYPPHVRKKITHLRNLIIQTANETKGVTTIEETLKWGEPSFLVKKGSTIRIDWKTKKPNQFAIYFQCTSKLVPTFKMVYRDTFTFEGNRAIIFQLEDAIPENELKNCITAALTYHTIKHLPTLGI